MTPTTLSLHALTSVQMVKDFLVGKDGIPADHNLLLEFLINGISEAVEKYCDRHFEKATYTDELYYGRGQQRLYLNQRPIVSVASVKENDSLLGSTEYQIFSEDGFLFRESGWSSGEYTVSSGLSDVRHPFFKRYNFKITYDAGYVLSGSTRTLPWDLEAVIVKIVGAEYKLRDKLGISSESFEGLSLTLTPWSNDIRESLDRYHRRVAIV